MNPNLIFVFADQLRAESVGFMGDQQVQTPYIDQLAAEGAAFTAAYTTNPVCTPARAAMLTGRYPHTTGVTSNQVQLPEVEVTITEVLQAAGYRTGYIGKWHLDGKEKPGFVPPGERRQGFEYWAGFNRGHFYYDSVYFQDTPTPIHSNRYEPDYQTDLALDFIRENRERPFCLFLSWGPPHTPLTPPEPYCEMYSPEDVVLRPNVPEEVKKKAARETALYNALTTSLDANIGRISQLLEELSLQEKTVVVFTSDHGDLLGSHGLFRKSQPHEESIHIPFAIRYPGVIPAGLKSDAPMSTVDWMPTLLGLLNQPIPAGVQGKDLSAILCGEEPQEVPDAVFLEGKIGRADEWRCLRTRQYSITVGADGKTLYLFDMQNDPFQLCNLAGCAEHEQLENSLLKQIQEWQMRVKDPLRKSI